MTRGLNYQLIKNAVSGDDIATGKIVRLYEPYINTLVSETVYDREGNEYIGINVDLQEQLRTKLIEVIHSFRII